MDAIEGCAARSAAPERLGRASGAQVERHKAERKGARKNWKVLENVSCNSPQLPRLCLGFLQLRVLFYAEPPKRNSGAKRRRLFAWVSGEA
eukprot:2768301-Alexandrium_andersonii.AAC.1